MLDGFRKADPPTTKQLPVEADVPEFLVQLGLSPEARELDRAIGDLTMIAFYYLLRIGEYTTKGTCNNSKRTEGRVTGPPPIALFCLVPKQSDWQLTFLPPKEQIVTSYW